MAYVTGKTIKELREKCNLTQKELADKINLSDKTISKWETGRGLPDIGIIEDLAKALGVSIAELLTGDYKKNDNQSANMRKMNIYICPICGNIITALGKGSFSCCGINLIEQETEECDDEHLIQLDSVEDEHLVTINHPMSKKHYISFVAYITPGCAEITKLYPEQDIVVRFKRKGHGVFYAYCNKHGLFKKVK
ncbi:MAG: helix-turn-helix domain-containing protein [Clostridia bacterium]|nr:helix-turn-helix domain-containing protein [Clostridia bacterium]